MSSLETVRQQLATLTARFIEGEFDQSTYSRLREDLLISLTDEERELLDSGVQAVGLRSTVLTFNPSGGEASGLATKLPQRLADVEFPTGYVVANRWEVIEELGRGGFGIVYRMLDRKLEDEVAVKILDPRMVGQQHLLARFRREVKVCRRLAHPNIVRVFDYFEDEEEDLALVSMELVMGGSVRELNALRRDTGQVIPLPVVVALIRQTLEALSHAHSYEVIHRDITPGNLLFAEANCQEFFGEFSPDVQVKLVDFGIAALAERSELSERSKALGTVAYVAPEVLDRQESENLTGAVDIYGLGAVAYELLTGRLALTRFERPSKLMAWPFDRIDDLILSMLEREPSRRITPEQALTAVSQLEEEARSCWDERLRFMRFETALTSAIETEDEGKVRELLETGAKEEWIQKSTARLTASEWLEQQDRKRRERERSLRDGLARAFDSKSESLVREALEALTLLHGAVEETDQQIAKVSNWLEEEQRKRREAEALRQQLEGERQELLRSIEGALRSGDVGVVTNLVARAGEESFRLDLDNEPLLTKARLWLAKQEQLKQQAAVEEREQREIEQLRERLRAALDSEDVTAVRQLGNSLRQRLGEAAEQDEDILRVMRWFEEHDWSQSPKSSLRLRGSGKAGKHLKELPQKSDALNELELRRRLETALSLDVREEIEIVAEELRRYLGEDAATDLDLARAEQRLKAGTGGSFWRWLVIGSAGAFVATLIVFLFVWLNGNTTGSGTARTGGIEIRSNVSGDLVIVDGEPRGPTPQWLGPGTYVIEVKKEGCSSEKRQIVLAAEEVRKEFFSLDCEEQ